MTLSLDRFASPLGDILLVFENETLRALDFWITNPACTGCSGCILGRSRLPRLPHPLLSRAPLGDFFAGDWAALDGIAVATGGTPFQRMVWAAVRQIRPGATLSYGAVAAAIGRPGASRAVGLANGANPLAIVVPCHRVIGANAALTGYGGGLARKAWLLAHEKAASRALPSLPSLDGAYAAA